VKINIKPILILAICFILITIVVRLTAFILEGEEGRLKRTIYKVKRLAEREDILRLTDYISSDYEDELGNDRRTLLFIAKGLFDECKNILILINSLEIEMVGDNAETLVEAAVYWQENNAGNFSCDHVRCKAIFIKDDNGWELIELQFFDPEEKRTFNPNIG
jgi:hypothetical protein